MSVASRWWVAAALTGALALVTPVAIAGFWFATVMLDTDRYVQTVAPLIDEPSVQQALVSQVTEQLVADVDVAALLEEAPVIGLLPGASEGLAELVAPLLDALESAVLDGLTAVVASEGFAAAWESANRSSHAGVIGSLTGQSDVVTVSGTDVTISADVLVEAARDGLAAQGLDTLAGLVPDVEAEILVLRSDALPVLQTGLRVLDLVGGWLWLVAVAAGVAVVVLCPRRIVGVGMAAGGVLLGSAGLTLVTALMTRAYVDGQPDVLSREARAVVADQLTADLTAATAAVAWSALLVLVIAAGAWWATDGRDTIRRARADQSP